MDLIRPCRWPILVLHSLLVSVAISAPAPENQYPLQAVGGGRGAGAGASDIYNGRRRLRGRFLHITDLHPDGYYKPHTSTEEDSACHRGRGPAGTYGAETSDCDSPHALVDSTLDWVRANLKDSIDFVVWTGDSARHDSDEEIPRHKKDILNSNRRIADAFVDTFSDKHGLVIPVIPTFGNNDIYPHNVLLPGPNEILKTYTDIWRSFIPEPQRHSFEFGGWFFVEVVPSKLAVFSLNTLYFFDRNGAVDDCISPSEPGYKHFEWLRIQLDLMRKNGMKVIFMGHVPPARTSGKQLWDETCWQKYTLWQQQYRDVIVASLYGHMNIDHFMLQDRKDIDVAILECTDDDDVFTPETTGDEISIQSSTDYLMELRDRWAQLPDPAALEQDLQELGKKGKGEDKLGGPWAERYQVTLISPSIVPNYFPTLRVLEYNITNLEDSLTWVDAIRTSDYVPSVPAKGFDAREGQDSCGRSNMVADKNRKKRKKDKGHKGKKPKNPNFRVPDPPVKGDAPGPAYFPQPLTLTGYTQYFANLTYINNDIMAEAVGDNETLSEEPEGDVGSLSKWDPGMHQGKKPKYKTPRPKGFVFEVEYSTFDDKVYKLKDLTVKSFVDLAHRIGNASKKKDAKSRHSETRSSPTDDDTEYDDSYGNDEASGNKDLDGRELEEEDAEFDGGKKKKHKHKGDKKKKKNKKHGKDTKVWLHFLKHAFVSTKTEEQLKDLG